MHISYIKEHIHLAICSVPNNNSDNDNDHDDCVKLNEPMKRREKVRKRKHCAKYADGMHV